MSKQATVNVLLGRNVDAIRRVLHLAGVDADAPQEFEYPQYTEKPEMVFGNLNELIDFLSSNLRASYYVGITADSDNYKYITYIDQGSLIYGADVESPAAYLINICKKVPIQWAYVAGDECPSESVGQFQDICIEASGPKLVNGRYSE